MNIISNRRPIAMNTRGQAGRFAMMAHNQSRSSNDESGRILWTKESKLRLLRLIRDNPVIVSPNVSAETMQKKDQAWANIEQVFAADGMICQLNKIKRLWKRMKDNARQSTVKMIEQRKCGLQHVRPPSELDSQVQQLLAARDELYNVQQRGKKRKLTPPPPPSAFAHLPPSITITSTPGSSAGLKRAAPIGSDPWPHPLQHTFGDSDGGFDPDYENSIIDGDDDDDFADLLTPIQQTSLTSPSNGGTNRHVHNANNRRETKPLTNGSPANIVHQDLTLDDEFDDCGDDDDDETKDEYAFHPARHSSAGDATAIDDMVDSTEQRSLQRDLLMQDIQLRQTQRAHEDERMVNERLLFVKRSQLLDLQIERAALEMRLLREQQQEQQQRQTPVEISKAESVESSDPGSTNSSGIVIDDDDEDDEELPLAANVSSERQPEI